MRRRHLDRRGLAGTSTLLERSLRPGGLLRVGEAFWRSAPPDQASVEGCGFADREDLHDLPGMIETLGGLGWDVVEMVLADEDSWDRYDAAQWLSGAGVAGRQPGRRAGRRAPRRARHRCLAGTSVTSAAISAGASSR